jgi:hypothetical protein
MPDNLAENYENHIPNAVRRAADRAEEIMREIAASAEQTANPAPVEQLVDPAPVAQPDPAPVTVSDNWEQRYRTLQGKYDSEVPTLRGRVTSLENLISSMQAAAAPPAPTTTVVAPTIPKEDIDAFGEDLVTAARRWARTEIQPEFDELKRRVDEMGVNYQKTTAQNAQERVMAALDADPDLTGKWRVINDAPAFIAWASQADPFSGQPRLQLLREAFSRGDALRTGRFFRAYMAEHTATSPIPPASPAHTPDTSGAGQLSLQDLAAPGRGGGPAPGGAPEKRIWTKQHITAFYRDCTNGKYAGREAERIRTEEDIFAAAHDGRLRP